VAVDGPVPARAERAAEHRRDEADDEAGGQGDRAALGQRPLIDRDAWQVQLVEHVVLRAAHHRQQGDRARDQDAP
jgi:hypothetical protein